MQLKRVQAWELELIQYMLFMDVSRDLDTGLKSNHSLDWKLLTCSISQKSILASDVVHSHSLCRLYIADVTKVKVTFLGCGKILHIWNIHGFKITNRNNKIRPWLQLEVSCQPFNRCFQAPPHVTRTDPRHNTKHYYVKHVCLLISPGW